uniref:Uncharacterized protein n=1 Tax=Anguilla anguilla TaxID=7936 RepID=A0A0E9XRT9_ANGAN
MFILKQRVLYPLTTDPHSDPECRRPRHHLGVDCA